jgi:hypothetical protein
MKTKDQSIETLRGIAVILVVMGYIARGDLTASHSIFASAVEFICYFFDPIRMPLFTVISAYLYASSPATQVTLKKLVTGKSRRILIPFFTVSAIQYTFYSVFNVGFYPLNQIYNVYLHPLDQFWFLWAIFWIFMAVGVLDSLKALDTYKKWLIWTGVMIVPHVLLVLPRLFSASGINYLFPFFLLGYGLSRYSKELSAPRMIKVYALVALIAYPVYLFLYEKSFSLHIYKLLALVVSFAAVPLLFYFRKTIPFLAKIGYYAFGIHIFNKIAVIFPRMLFERAHVDNAVLIVVTYLGCAIIFSIGLQIILEQFNLSRKYILGMKELPQLVPAPVIVQPQPAVKLLPN